MDFTGLQKEFREHGAVVLRSVLSPAGVARCRQAYDEILRDWAARSGVAGLPSYSDAMVSIAMGRKVIFLPPRAALLSLYGSSIMKKSGCKNITNTAHTYGYLAL